MELRYPRVFLGCSVEALQLAEKIQYQLLYECEIQLWTQGIFKNGSTSLGDLVNSISKFDYAAFLFTFDDVTVIRKEEYRTVRDNILFEYGLFTGALGSKKTWFIVDVDEKASHLPTDFLGINPIKYKSSGRSLDTIAGVISGQLRECIRALEIEYTDDTYKSRQLYQKFKEEKELRIKHIASKLESAGTSFYDCGILAVDVDDFEKINRNFGRETGDKIIEKIQEIIVPYLNGMLKPENYYFTKFQGDEFFVIVNKQDYLPMIGGFSLENLANAIVAMIHGYKWDEFVPNLYLSCSVGYTTPNRNEKIEECLARSLYATKIAKRYGGNSTCPAPIINDPRAKIDLFHLCSLRD